MKIKILLILLFTIKSLFFLDVKAAKSGDFIVYSFEEFEHWLNKDTDSLYVINFWATWCAPCVKEIPDFEKLYGKYKTEKVKLLFVSLDFPSHIENRVIPFIERMNMKAQVVLLDDPRSNRWIPEVSDSWSGAIPATLIYNREFRQFYEREFNFEELEEIIVPLLK
jgi:thiol-disulfide isomerase/thioredoxin